MKLIIKSAFLIYVYALVTFFNVLKKIVGFELVATRISKLPYRTGNHVRYNFYKKHLKSVGDNVTFSFGCIVTNINTVIGNNVRFGPFNTIGLAKIGDDVITAQHVHILSGSKQHSFEEKSVPMWKQKGTISCVKLHGDNWIGASVVIMADVGYGTVVGSGSVVVKSISNMCISAGNPCKELSSRP